jgi:predicted nucleic acid-binding protein
MKIFIDTNIFLDALLKREPFKIPAEQLLNL